VWIIWINPDALAIKARLKALNTDNSKEEPEEANEERYIDE